MGIVSMEELNRHMSSPRWHADQQQAAAALLDTVEGQLAGALSTYITPPERALTQRAQVSQRTGLVMLTYPVFAVETVDGVAGPTNYERRNGRLYALVPPSSPATVLVTYRPGWGPDEALRGVILERAANRFDNRHDDTITVRDDSTTRNNSGGSEKAWPDADTLERLRPYRTIVGATW